MANGMPSRRRNLSVRGATPALLDVRRPGQQQHSALSSMTPKAPSSTSASSLRSTWRRASTSIMSLRCARPVARDLLARSRSRGVSRRRSPMISSGAAVTQPLRPAAKRPCPWPVSTHERDHWPTVRPRPTYQLAQHLDTVNLPADNARLEAMLIDSERQLAGSEQPDEAMIFVLEDASGALRGSATIIARHGSPQAPHCFFDVIDEERYSPRLDQVFQHKVLRLGTGFIPRTEIGGLVLDLRCAASRCTSLCRFQFIAAYQDRFCDHILAGAPPLARTATRALDVGQRFTGLTYHEADHLGGRREFIEDLFPAAISTELVQPEDASRDRDRGRRDAEAPCACLSRICPSAIDPFVAGRTAP